MSDSEQEIFHRPSLDANCNDNECDEFEEDSSYHGHGSKHRLDDEFEEQEEEIVTIEPSDSELIHEIEQDQQLLEQYKAEFERIKLEMLQNGSLCENDTYTFELNATQLYHQIPRININTHLGMDTDPNAQLTTFEENIITTGSSASIVLLLILCITFIVQLVRKLYQYLHDSKISRETETPLDENTIEPTIYDARLVLNLSYIYTNFISILLCRFFFFFA